MHEAELLLHYPAPLAQAIHGALRPEADAGVPKTRTRIAPAPEGLRIRLDADDLPSLRAALNSYLRWTDTAARGAGSATGEGQPGDG